MPDGRRLDPSGAGGCHDPHPCRLPSSTAASLDGLAAPEVTVEVHLANGLPSFTLVGLADTEVKEARERVRAALLTSGLDFPHNKRVTVNLAPADLPKESGRFDLPIALGILAASGQLDAARLGRLRVRRRARRLAGDLRPVRGALALGAGAAPPRRDTRAGAAAGERRGGGAGRRRWRSTARRTCSTWCARCCRATPPSRCRAACARPPLAPPPVRRPARRARARPAPSARSKIAAAGGHSLLMVGPPGTGKSMLAQRLAGMLPPMTQDEALESAALLSLTGGFDPARWRQRRGARSRTTARRAVALVGGGSPPRPGEISLAHHGVLFLDELPEFPRAALEALREPLETGRIIDLARGAAGRVPGALPARRGDEPVPLRLPRAARCAPAAARPTRWRATRAGSAGPLLDRIDLQVEVPARRAAGARRGARRRAERGGGGARARAPASAQLARQGCTNAALAGDALDRACRARRRRREVPAGARRARLGWSARGFHRVLRMARSVADLAGAADIEVPHLAEAIQWRRVLDGPQ